MAVFANKGVQDYAKVDYDYLLMKQIELCGVILSKLPHEMLDERFPHPIGMKYEDVVKAYADSVQHLESMLKPYWNTDEEYKKINAIKRKEELEYSTNKFGELMCLADRKGLLLQKIRTGVRADVDEFDDDQLNQAAQVQG